MHDWLWRAQLGNHLATSTRAGDHGLLDFVLAFPAQLPNHAASGRNVRNGWCYSRSRDVVYALQQPASFREIIERLVCSFGQIDGLFAPEQPMHEPVDLLAADQGQPVQAFLCFRQSDPNQAKWNSTILMTCEAVPEAHDQSPDQFIGGVYV